MSHWQAEKLIELMNVVAGALVWIAALGTIYLAAVIGPSIRCYLHRWWQYFKGEKQTCTCRRKP